MTEKELESALCRLLRELGLFGFHAYDSRRSAPGWPDWVIVGSRLLFRELKSDAGDLTRDQRRVRNLLVTAGADWAVWTPRDLRSGRIARELTAITRSDDRGNG